MTKKKNYCSLWGGAVATSTVAATRIAELCKEQGIPVEVVQCRVSEITANCDNVDLIVTTARVTKDYGVPLENGMAFISGVGIEAAEERILRHLK
ncbi:PTS galactitol transporter subunit IIB [Ectobacillus funiculus]